MLENDGSGRTLGRRGDLIHQFRGLVWREAP
jgi:hypothetical protein